MPRPQAKPEIAGVGDASIAGAAHAPAGRAHARANLALRPEELTPEHTPQEMRVWLAQFRSYYSTSGFSTCTLEDQHAYFLQCLNPTLRFRVERHVEARTPIFGDAPAASRSWKRSFCIATPFSCAACCTSSTSSRAGNR